MIEFKEKMDIKKYICTSQHWFTNCALFKLPVDGIALHPMLIPGGLLKR